MIRLHSYSVTPQPTLPSMKTSELITHLQDLQQSLGDIEVLVADGNVYTEYGEPKEFDDSKWSAYGAPAVRICS